MPQLGGDGKLYVTSPISQLIKDAAGPLDDDHRIALDLILANVGVDGGDFPDTALFRKDGSFYEMVYYETDQEYILMHVVDPDNDHVVDIIDAKCKHCGHYVYDEDLEPHNLDVILCETC